MFTVPETTPLPSGSRTACHMQTHSLGGRLVLRSTDLRGIPWTCVQPKGHMNVYRNHLQGRGWEHILWQNGRSQSYITILLIKGVGTQTCAACLRPP
jgi:hypothetical protein